MSDDGPTTTCFACRGVVSDMARQCRHCGQYLDHRRNDHLDDDAPPGAHLIGTGQLGFLAMTLLGGGLVLLGLRPDRKIGVWAVALLVTGVLGLLGGVLSPRRRGG
jgi:hypothetical protein